MREERMLKFHTESLVFLQNEKVLKNFEKPKIEGDTITSINEKDRIVHITRHLLTGESTHSLILSGENYERL